jgi:membrane protease YdiL (CAAX protease family)
MSADAAPLSSSAFIAGLTREERSPWRFLLTVTLGAVVFLAAAVVGILVSLALLIGLAGWPIPTDLGHLKALLMRFVALAKSDGRSLGDQLQLLALAIPDNVIPIFTLVGLAALIYRRPLKAFVTAAPRFRWAMLLSGAVLSALVIGPFVLFSQMTDPKAGPAPLLTESPAWWLDLAYALVCLAAFLPAALGEEMLFRGWLLRETSAITRNPVALIVINGIVFAAGHFQFSPDAFLERAILGGAFTYMTLRVGGIELSTGAHLSNNLLLVLFVEPLTLQPPPSENVTVASMVEFAYLIGSYVLVAEVTARWRPLRRWTGVDQVAAPQTVAAAEHVS